MSANAVALTTAFVQPTGCYDQFITTTATYKGHDTAQPTLINVLVSDPPTSCNLFGRHGGEPESRRLQLSPGACPIGWTHHGIAEDDSHKTTAFCCNIGYDFQDYHERDSVYSIFPNQCEKHAPNHDEPSGVDAPTAPTLMVHEAWAVAWDAFDRSTLKPELPGLTNNIEASFRAAREKISHVRWNRRSDSTSENDSSKWIGIYFAIIGLPIIIAALIGVGIWRLVVNARKDKRKRLARATASSATAKPSTEEPV